MSPKLTILVAVVVAIAIGAALYLISNQAPPTTAPQPTPTTTQQTTPPTSPKTATSPSPAQQTTPPPSPATTRQTTPTPSTATTQQTTPVQSSTSPQTTATPPQYITIRDVLGREVQIKLPVRRVVAIGPGALRLVVYLNATDKLAGIEALEKRPPQGRDYGYVLWAKNLTGLPVVGQGGPGSPVNFEAIIEARPDVIIMTPTLANTPDEVQAKTGIPVVAVTYGTTGTINFTELFYSLKILGQILDREQRARQLIAYMQSLIKDLERRTANVTNRPKVYAGAISYRGGRPFTSTQSGFPPLVLLKTPSVADKYNIMPGAQISWEALLKEQPDVVFIDLGNYLTVVQDFNKSKDPYCSLNAFKQGKVYGVLPFNHYWTNIATMLADAYYMGKVLYPDRFADVDPAKKANEIYTEFLGMPLYQKIAKDFGGGFRQLSFPCG